MTSIKINNSEIIEMLNVESPNFPRYTTILINQANRFAQGTRPKIVGQMSELFPKFLNESSDKSYDSWKKWYLEEHPTAINDATEKTYELILNFKEAIQKIDENMTKRWIEDLILLKTYVGLFIQGIIILKIADIKKVSYRFSNAQEESRGIDGYIGEVPVSVKPITYRTQDILIEEIDAEIIYYDKKNDGLVLEYDF